MTSEDIELEKQACIDDLIANSEFEIYEMNKIINLINSEKWEEVDFCLNLKNVLDWKNEISSFNFKSSVPEKYITAIKKLIKMAFEEGIQIKKKKLEDYKNI